MSPGANSGTPSDSLRFVCKGCGTPLILPDASAAVSGPCPKCAVWIDAREFIGPQPGVTKPNVHVPEPGSLQRHRSQVVIGGRGRIRADGYLDHEYNERRELFGTLRVIAVSLAVLAVILFITLYMRQWLRT